MKGERPVSARVRQRARPQLILVDSELRIVHYEPGALKLLEETFGPHPAGILPPAIADAVRASLAISDRNEEQTTVLPASSLLVHVSHVFGGDRSYYALLLEKEMRRAPVDTAARRFKFTRREREVLLLMMRGLHASDIAKTLSISPTTVTGYFKQLLEKTKARNRSEMIARVLDWEEPDAPLPRE